MLTVPDTGLLGRLVYSTCTPVTTMAQPTFSVIRLDGSRSGLVEPTTVQVLPKDLLHLNKLCTSDLGHYESVTLTTVPMSSLTLSGTQ